MEHVGYKISFELYQVSRQYMLMCAVGRFLKLSLLIVLISVPLQTNKAVGMSCNSVKQVSAVTHRASSVPDALVCWQCGL